MSEEEFTVVKFTTHDGEEFYERTPEREVQSKVEEVVRRTRNVYQVDILEMTKEELAAIPITDGAVSFFRGPSAYKEGGEG